MKEITRKTIEALRQEAGRAGDMAEVAICDKALAGDDDAWRYCTKRVEDTRRMSEE